MQVSPSDVSAAVALAQTLRAQASALAFSELAEKLKTASEALARFEQRRAALREAHRQAVDAVRKREATLLMEQPDLIPIKDPEYRKLRGVEQATREQLSALGDEEEKIRQLSSALNAEVSARDARLRQLARSAHYDSWKGKAQERITAARQALAEALIAYCADRTMSPLGADAGLFFESVVGRGDVNALIRQIVEAEHKRLREQIITRDRMLG